MDIIYICCAFPIVYVSQVGNLRYAVVTYSFLAQEIGTKFLAVPSLSLIYIVYYY